MFESEVTISPHIPATEQRFLCDEMLIRLARWLRTAGYDTAVLRAGTSDMDLMSYARAQKRVLLTRDRKFLERRHADASVFLIVSTDVEEQVKDVTKRFRINWLKAPFTRCLVDNALVRPVKRDQITHPPKFDREMTGPYTCCPACGRFYWIGSHARRMRGQLEAWAQGALVTAVQPADWNGKLDLL